MSMTSFTMYALLLNADPSVGERRNQIDPKPFRKIVERNRLRARDQVSSVIRVPECRAIKQSSRGPLGRLATNSWLFNNLFMTRQGEGSFRKQPANQKYAKKNAVPGFSLLFLILKLQNEIHQNC